jgi:hypothetical protein
VSKAANAHIEVIVAQEALLQARVEAVEEIWHVKDATTCQVEKEVNSLKKKLEVAQQKTKDAADNLQAIVAGMFVGHWVLSSCL